MTRQLYYEDAYIQEFEAVITAVDQGDDQGDDRGDDQGDGALRIALDQTAFYPGGGGQPNDVGWLTVNGVEFQITKVKKEADLIWHWIAHGTDTQGGTDGGEPLITIGAAVHGKLDWERRHHLMRTHTSMHILCGVAWRDYQAKATGSNMDVGSGRLDFEFEALTSDMIGEIEAKCNAEIEAARAITSQILPRDEAYQIPDLIGTKTNLLPEDIKEIRIVDIAGLDLQADGGTHVNNTSEVGWIKVVNYKSKGKINKRIYMEVVAGG